MNEAAIPEALDPQGKRKASPCPREVLRGLPEEDGDASARYAGDDGGEHKKAAERRVRGIDRLEDAKTEDEHEAY